MKLLASRCKLKLKNTSCKRLIFIAFGYKSANYMGVTLWREKE